MSNSDSTTINSQTYNAIQSGRALLSGELDWKRPLKPNDLTDLQKCKEIDEFNQGVWEYNNSMLPRINALLEKMGLPKHKLDAPVKYYPMARKKYDELIRGDEFRMLKAVEFLHARGKVAVRDYALPDGPALADDIAEREEIQRLIAVSKRSIDIKLAVGLGHEQNCTCGNRWDGVSERCLGEGARLRWKRGKYHHFLQPEVYPETY